MKDTLAQVRAAYDHDPEWEWRRLESGAQYRLEQLVTMHALKRHLPAVIPDRHCHVLDAGGGPGRYTLALAAQGYMMSLLDLSPALLALARQRIAEAGPAIREQIPAVVEGSITDLSRFGDEQFDAVLCLGGVLSHVIEAAPRRQALTELRRVAKPGALLFIAVMNRLGAYRSTVQWPNCYTQYFPHLPETGIAAIGPGGALTYYFLPEEFVSSLAAADLEPVRLYGCNGLGAHLQEEHLNALMADPERWPTWRKQLLATCDHPSIVGVSNHLLAVVRRPEPADGSA